jgi:dTDP-4-dehydrorhamnose reductase
VFDGRRGDYSEDDTPNPLNVYARTKLEGEREALRIGGSLVVRFNVIGPEHLTSWILSSAVRGEPIDVYTDVLFNPVEAGDLARMVCSLCESRLAGKCHIGSDETISKAEYAERLVAHAGLQHRARLTRCRLAESPPRALRPLNTSLRIADHVRLVAAPPSLDAAIRRLATGTTANEPSPRGMP